MDFKALVAAPLVAFLVVASANEVVMPQRWSSASTGSNSSSFRIGLDTQVTFNGQRSLTVKAESGIEDVSYGTAIQYVNSFGYEGKRVRFSGTLKTDGVTQWAGVWLAPGFLTTFDLDQPQLPVGMGLGRGAHDWSRVSVVIDVPTTQQIGLSMGVALVGEGQVWLSDLKFEEVDTDTPVTLTLVELDRQKLKALRTHRDRGPIPTVKQVPANLGLEP